MVKFKPKKTSNGSDQLSVASATFSFAVGGLGLASVVTVFLGIVLVRNPFGQSLKVNPSKSRDPEA